MSAETAWQYRRKLDKLQKLVCLPQDDVTNEGHILCFRRKTEMSVEAMCENQTASEWDPSFLLLFVPPFW